VESKGVKTRDECWAETIIIEKDAEKGWEIIKPWAYVKFLSSLSN